MSGPLERNRPFGLKRRRGASAASNALDTSDRSDMARRRKRRRNGRFDNETDRHRETALRLTAPIERPVERPVERPDAQTWSRAADHWGRDLAEKSLRTWKYGGFDEAQTEAIWRRCHAEATEKEAQEMAAAQGAADGLPVAETRSGTVATPVDLASAWRAMCQRRADAIRKEPGVVPASEYDRLAEDMPADRIQARAIINLAGHYWKAERALRAQVAAAAAWNDVSETVANQRLQDFRELHRSYLSYLPDEEQPHPPAMWVDGFTRRDYKSRDVPADPATLYAFYRLVADPDAFTSRERRGTLIVSVDLETANEPGKPTGDPTAGRIIEYGSITVDPATGERIGSQSFLINPGPDALDSYGTGATDIHGIMPSDVIDQPSWPQMAPIVDIDLMGKRILAQNAAFEGDWIAHHLQQVGRAFEADQPMIDTYRITLQHLELPGSYRLAAICEHLGVPYTNGHRSMHDAEVALAVYGRLREEIAHVWEQRTGTWF